jgi:hypothetical protein
LRTHDIAFDVSSWSTRAPKGYRAMAPHILQPTVYTKNQLTWCWTKCINHLFQWANTKNLPNGNKDMCITFHRVKSVGFFLLSSTLSQALLYHLVFDQITSHIQESCQQRNKHPHLLHKRNHCRWSVQGKQHKKVKPKQKNYISTFHQNTKHRYCLNNQRCQCLHNIISRLFSMSLMRSHAKAQLSGSCWSVRIRSEMQISSTCWSSLKS